jgi:carbon-monoxide dehydrogenase large subunit
LIAPDVGGAFGMKASLYPEDIFVVWAALKLKRAVRWTATRNEDLLAATHGRGTHTRGALALTDDGEFVALNAAIVCPLGHWLPHSGAIPAWNAARILPGPYRIDSVDISTRGVFTNTAPVGIYRGAGRPEAAMLMELLVDRAAAIADLATEEIRRRNLLTFNELPRTGPTGIRLDSGDYPAALAKLCELADISGLRRIRRARRQAGELVGIGVAFFIEPCGAGWESARVTYRNGSVTAAVGTSSQGQGRETAYAQILADIFSVAMHQVDVVHGDTGTCPAGIGALASRSTAIGASAVYQAALQVKNKLTDNLEPRESIEANVVYTADNEAWGYGCYLAVVSIDRETGSPCVEKMACLDDAGTVINPLLSEGQIVGGIAQGIGESLLEKIVYDADGQLLTGSLLDYALPRATDMPDIIIGEMETAADGNALGAKGIGEAGSIGAPAAVVNAVADALTEFGIPEVRMPLTAEAIWQFMKTASDGT